MSLERSRGQIYRRNSPKNSVPYKKTKKNKVHRSNKIFLTSRKNKLKKKIVLKPTQLANKGHHRQKGQAKTISG